MKIRNISIRGFRGFNLRREIDFHPRLTLISAQNSYGKTSITEAFEWLIYGATSKVEFADSKDEYKGSYRNVHLAVGDDPEVSLTLTDSDSEMVLSAKLVGDDLEKFINGHAVKEWPFANSTSMSPKPFILQHALKNLLLATPVERFENFAHLLGFSELGKIHKDLISFCTKAPLPESIRRLKAEVEALMTRAAARPGLVSIAKELNRGLSRINEAYQLIRNKCEEYVPRETEMTSLLPRLLIVRDEAVEKVFKGKIVLEPFTPREGESNSEDEEVLASAVTAGLIDGYLSLAKMKTIKNVRDLAELYNIGIRLLEGDRSVCPLCRQPLSEELTQHMRERHAGLTDQRREFDELEKRQTNITQALSGLKTRFTVYHERLTQKVGKLLALEGSLAELKSILEPKHTNHYGSVVKAIDDLKEATDKLIKASEGVLASIKKVEGSITSSEESRKDLESLANSLIDYLRWSQALKLSLGAHVVPVREAAQILKYELDVRAGTQDVSILIDLLEREREIQKKFKIDVVLESVKELKKQIDELVSSIMLTAFSGEFAAEVTDWYRRIKTTGDPDVHFSGFDMKRTAQGGRVQIKAQSYEKDLVSAVSSLSESKLNALGLCISIAVNCKSTGPFDFLIIDDPIQSWDEDHGAKFIEVVKELVRRGKQVVLLSHNEKWVRDVGLACAELNGLRYEITGYTKEGPHIREVPWAVIQQRLSTIQGIVNDPKADRIRIQQGEEEIRFILTQLASDLHFKKTGNRKSPHKLNAEETKKLLLAGGVTPDLVNKLISTMKTVDDAHHSSPEFTPNRDTLRTHHEWVCTLHTFVQQVK